MKRAFRKWMMAAGLACGLLVAACSSADNHAAVSEVLPAEPDYGEASQWYVTDRCGKADIFYIISTETGDYPLADGTTAHYADTYADSLRQPMYSEMAGVDTLVSGCLNFYSPYYRQCSLQSFASQSLADARMPVPTDDVRRAFAYYLAHQNQGRPFILAGFSQGAYIMLDLLREMDDADYARMIAAYAKGINVAQAEKHIVPVKGEGDTGVTICYNSVRDASCALWEGRSAFAINPVNWRTDGEAATLITEPSPLVPVSEQQKDAMTVRLDMASNLLFVSGYTATDYVLPLIGKDGNYHSREIWLYRDQLKQNMSFRAEHF